MSALAGAAGAAGALATADRPPRVALVHDWLTGMRGGEKVLEAIAVSFPTAPIFTLFHFRGSVSATLESHRVHTSPLQVIPGLRRSYRYFLPLFPWAVERFDLRGFDLVVSTSHCVAKGVAAPDGVHICYCHTPVRYAWDQQEAYFGTSRSPLARVRSGLLARLRSWDQSTAHRVDHFLANSNFVRSRIQRYYGRDAEVLAPPVDLDFFRLEDGSPPLPEEPFLLSVAALSPYKRHDVAIEAARRAGLRLKIVGSGPDLQRLRQLGDHRLELLGRVDDEQLRRLYRQASLFVQPGIEDFGIAAVEALACGTPVVAAGSGGVRDIVEHERHGVLYDCSPASEVEALRTAIDKALQLRFNPLDLQERAETFRAASFQRRFRDFLARYLSPALSESFGLRSKIRAF